MKIQKTASYIALAIELELRNPDLKEHQIHRVLLGVMEHLGRADCALTKDGVRKFRRAK